jgi:hypothetical protein
VLLGGGVGVRQGESFVAAALRKLLEGMQGGLTMDTLLFGVSDLGLGVAADVVWTWYLPAASCS